MSPEELRKIFNQKKQKIERTISKKGIVKEKLVDGFEKTTFEEFQTWFKNSKYQSGCNYCGTSSISTLKLYNDAISGARHNWTRGGKRGKRLELDRVDPFKKYDELKNLVWCCYWCNNAKSNFFTKDEFEPIAKEIGKAIKKIMGQH
jgi:hypothetical protein